jgi:CheY-like chemotaxis protein
MTRVLLVEDNEMNRDMLSRRLIRKGYEVILAVDGDQAVSIASAELPDVILMDMSLPKLHGSEVTRILRSNVRTSNLPIIALTAHAMASDRDAALACGCDDFETKPIDLPRLLEKIEIQLARRRGVQPA